MRLLRALGLTPSLRPSALALGPLSPLGPARAAPVLMWFFAHAGDTAGDAAGKAAGDGTRPARGMTWPPAQPFSRVLELARQLDSAAVSQLYKRFLPVVYRYVLARVGDTHTAEDLTSDTFIAMVEQIRSVRAQDELGFSAWLLGIARNKLLMHYRRRRSGPTFTRQIEDDAHPATVAEEGDPLAIITARESWSEVAAALNRLTEEQRTVVLYRCVLGYSAEDVAGLMGKKAGTVRALQFRALASLARLLDLDKTHEKATVRSPRSADHPRRDARRKGGE